MSLYYCDRCGAEDVGQFAAAGTECGKISIIRQDAFAGLRDYLQACAGTIRESRHLTLSQIAALKAAARREAEALVRTGEDSRIEREVDALHRQPRAADLIPDVERDGSRPHIVCLVQASFLRRLRRRPMAGRAQ